MGKKAKGKASIVAGSAKSVGASSKSVNSSASPAKQAIGARKTETSVVGTPLTKSKGPDEVFTQSTFAISNSSQPSENSSASYSGSGLTSNSSAPEPTDKRANSASAPSNLTSTLRQPPKAAAAEAGLSQNALQKSPASENFSARSREPSKSPPEPCASPPNSTASGLGAKSMTSEAVSADSIELLSSKLSATLYARSSLEQVLDDVYALQALLFDAVLHKVAAAADMGKNSTPSVKPEEDTLSPSCMASIQELLDAQRDFDSDLLSIPKLCDFLAQNGHNPAVELMSPAKSDNTRENNVENAPSVGSKDSDGGVPKNSIKSVPRGASKEPQSTASTKQERLDGGAGNKGKKSSKTVSVGPRTVEMGDSGVQTAEDATSSSDEDGENGIAAPRRILSWWHFKAETNDHAAKSASISSTGRMSRVGSNGSLATPNASPPSTLQSSSYPAPPNMSPREDSKPPQQNSLPSGRNAFGGSRSLPPPMSGASTPGVHHYQQQRSPPIEVPIVPVISRESRGTQTSIEEPPPPTPPPAPEVVEPPSPVEPPPPPVEMRSISVQTFLAPVDDSLFEEKPEDDADGSKASGIAADERVKKVVNEMRVQLDQSLRSYEELCDELEKRADAVKAAREAADTLQLELESKTLQLAATQKLLSEHESEREGLRTHVERSEASLIDQKQQLSASAENAERLAAEIHQLQEEVSAKTLVFERKEKEDSVLRENLATAETRLRELETAVSEFHEFRRTLESDRAARAPDGNSSFAQQQQDQQQQSSLQDSLLAFVESTNNAAVLSGLRESGARSAAVVATRSAVVGDEPASEGAGPACSQEIQVTAKNWVSHGDLARMLVRENLTRDLLSENLLLLGCLRPSSAEQTELEDLNALVAARVAAWKVHRFDVSVLLRSHMRLCIRSVALEKTLEQPTAEKEEKPGPAPQNNKKKNANAKGNGSKQDSSMKKSEAPEQPCMWLDAYRAYCRWLISLDGADEFERSRQEIEQLCMRINPVGWENIYAQFFKLLMKARTDRPTTAVQRDSALPEKWFLDPWYCVNASDLGLDRPNDISALPALFGHMRAMRVKNILVLGGAAGEMGRANDDELRSRLLLRLFREASRAGFRVVCEARYHVMPIEHIWCQRALSGNDEHARRFVRRDEWEHVEPSDSSAPSDDAISMYEDRLDGTVTACSQLTVKAEGGPGHLVPAVLRGQAAQFFSSYGNAFMALDLRAPEHVVGMLERIVREMNDADVLGKVYCDVEHWIERSGGSPGCMSPEGVALFTLARRFAKMLSPRAVSIARPRREPRDAASRASLAACFDAVILSDAQCPLVASCVAENSSHAVDFLLLQRQHQLQERQQEKPQDGASAGAGDTKRTREHQQLVCLFAFDYPFAQIDTPQNGIQGANAGEHPAWRDLKQLYCKHNPTNAAFVKMGDLIEGSESRKLHVLLLLLYLSGHPPVLAAGTELLVPSSAGDGAVSSVSLATRSSRLRDSLLEERMSADEESVQLIARLNDIFSVEHESSNKSGSTALAFAGEKTDEKRGFSLEPFQCSETSAFAFVLRADEQDLDSTLVAGNLGPTDVDLTLDVADVLLRLQLPVGLFTVARVLDSSETRATLNVNKNDVTIQLAPYSFCVFKLESTLSAADEAAATTSEAGQALLRHVDSVAAFLPSTHARDGSAALPTVRPIVFEWTQPWNRSVTVVGSFTRWKKFVHLTRVQTDEGEASDRAVGIIFVPAGNHDLKFIVDGAWQCSPTLTVRTGGGEENNVVQVPELLADTTAYESDCAVLQSWHNHLMRSARLSADAPRERDVLVPRLFLWPSDAAQRVLLCGSFDGWRELYPLALSPRGKYHWTVINLPVGVFYYRFLVDGAWCISLRDTHETDSTGFESNVVQVM